MSNFAYDRKPGLAQTSAHAFATLCASLTHAIAAMVHPVARDDAMSATHHEIFITSRLITSLVAIALFPVFLANQGVPILWQAAAFCWICLPLLAVVIVSRTGFLVLAQLVCAFCLIGLATTFAAAGHFGGAMAWLLLVPIEVALSTNLKSLIASIAFSCACAMLIYALAAGGWFVAPFFISPALQATILIPGVIYAASVGYLFVSLHRVGREVETEGLARFDSLSDVVGDLVMQHDCNGAVISASATCQTLFDIAASDLFGRGFIERVNVADRPAFLKTISDALSADGICTVQLRFRTGRATECDEDFSDYPVRLRSNQEAATTAAPIFAHVELRARRMSRSASAQAKSRGFTVVSVVRDITDAKRHEEEILAARASAERLNLWKDRLLANVSHELRTPLNAIIGFAELLGNADLAPKSQCKRDEYANIIASSGHHLLQVVNCILDMSKIEAGSFQITAEPFDLMPLMNVCCDMFTLKASDGGIDLVRDFSLGKQIAFNEIVADKRAIKQILINLISNAVKFTPNGGKIAVSVKPMGNSVYIRVADSGIGIKPGDLAQLGVPFFQAASTYDRAYEGTGLGLSVVRGLVGLHGGDMRIESEAHRGTIITIRLPLDCRYSGVAPSAALTISTGPLPISDAADDDMILATMVKRSA